MNGRSNSRLIVSTATERTPAARATTKPRARKSRWKGDGAASSARTEATAPKRVLRPVATARAVASPVWAIDPRNSALVASAGDSDAVGPGRSSTGRLTGQGRLVGGKAGDF